MFSFDDSTSSPHFGGPLTAPPAVPGATPVPVARQVPQPAPIPFPVDRPGSEETARATPIFHALLREWRRTRRAVPGERGDEEIAALTARPAFAAMLPAPGGGPERDGGQVLYGGRHRGAAAAHGPADRPAGLRLVPVPQPGGPGHLPL